MKEIIVLVLFFLHSSVFYGQGNFINEFKSDNELNFSSVGGFYTLPEYIKITSFLDDTIYYTLDGSLPTETSNVYVDSIFLDYKYNSPNHLSEIPSSPQQSLIGYKAWESPDVITDKASILRCATFKNGERTSRIYTHTYFIDSSIFEKFSTPVLSLVTESNNLFNSDSGIYVPGIHYDLNNPGWTGNYFKTGDQWERPVHIEYFENDGNLGFSQDAGIRIHGGKTRCAAQKSLKLYAREEYGTKYFNYKILPQKQNQKYKRFLLRTSMGAWEGETIINDVLAHDCVRDLDIEYQDFNPALVYINGEYWGIHTIRDRIDERYIAYLYDLDKDSVDLIGNNFNLVFAGSNEHYVNLIEFIELNNLYYQSNYDYVKTQMDIDNYIDYQISEMFFKNYDWPSNNVKLWRPQTPDGKWRWIFYDIDAGFLNYNYNMFLHATRNDENVTWPNSPASTFLFRNLLKNNSFKNQFINRYAEILNEDFAKNVLIDKLNIIKELYKAEVPSNISRWHYPESFFGWENDIEENLKSFIENRPCVVEENITDFFDLAAFGFSCENDINENSRDSKFILAPNPSNGIFFLLNNSSEPFEGKICITDISGKIVYNREYIFLGINEKKHFNLKGMSGNLYVITLYNSSFLERRKIVINTNQVLK